MKENTGDDNRTDDSPSIIISKPTAVPEPLRLCSESKTQSRTAFFSLQRDSESIKKMDGLYHHPADSPKERPEIFQDFVFFSGSKPMKRKRITGERPINRADKDQG